MPRGRESGGQRFSNSFRQFNFLGPQKKVPMGVVAAVAIGEIQVKQCRLHRIRLLRDHVSTAGVLSPDAPLTRLSLPFFLLSQTCSGYLAGPQRAASSLSPALSPRDISGFFLHNGELSLPLSPRATSLAPPTHHSSSLLSALPPTLNPTFSFFCTDCTNHGLAAHPTLRLRMYGGSGNTRIIGPARICEKLCRTRSVHYRRRSHGRFLVVPRGQHHLYLRRGERRCCHLPRPASYRVCSCA